jgi:tripartite-type tricarboxylate transporter receptor subunit TctC
VRWGFLRAALIPAAQFYEFSVSFAATRRGLFSSIYRNLFMRIQAVLAVICAAGISSLALAQAFPTKPIKLVVPFAPGAGTDTVARLVGQKLGESLGQPVVIENKTGASGAIGADYVAKAEPDGYTLLFVASPFTTVAASDPSVRYDPIRQYAPVALIATGPLVWVVNASSTANSLKEFAALSHAKSGTFAYGSAGAGGINHLALESFKNKTDADILHVPYKGIAPATLDLIGGQIHAITGTIPAVQQYLKSGKLKALAVLGPTRNALLPDVPSAKEAGFPEVIAMNYWGIVAPANAPKEIIAKLNSEVQKLLAQPDFRARMDAEGVEITPGGPERMGAMVAGDFMHWQKLVAVAKIKVTQ